MFLSTAMAQAQDAAAKGPSFVEQMVPFVFIFILFYFLLIRPQSKRAKEHQQFVTNLKRGDAVLTASGIYGKIDGLTDKFVTLEVADGVNVRVLRTQIASSVNEGVANV